MNPRSSFPDTPVSRPVCIPNWATVDAFAVVTATAAFVAMFRFKTGMIPTLSASAAAGLLYFLIRAFFYATSRRSLLRQFLSSGAPHTCSSVTVAKIVCRANQIDRFTTATRTPLGPFTVTVAWNDAPDSAIAGRMGPS